jgi:glycopeptide antibiotics resistance protein
LDLLVFRNTSPLELFKVNRPVYRSINILPFQSITSYLSGSIHVSRSIAFTNIFGNICLFIPLGIYLQLLKKDKRISLGIILILLTSVSVEIIQFITGLGAADIDDVLLNGLGGVIGILCYRLLTAFLKDAKKVRSVIAVLVAIAGIPLLCLVILLILFN